MAFDPGPIVDAAPSNVEGLARALLEALELSPREWTLLDLLVTERDRVVTKPQIVAAWGSEDSAGGSIEVYIHRLRKKLEGSGLAVRTVRGLGYLLEATASPA